MQNETANPDTTPDDHERRFDVLRNSADLYGAVHQIVSVLAAYDLAQSELGYFQSRHLCQIATKVLPHLPAPAEDANGW